LTKFLISYSPMLRNQAIIHIRTCRFGSMVALALPAVF
jgi:hypothetical protein